jgi:hypothetical protein
VLARPSCQSAKGLKGGSVGLGGGLIRRLVMRICFAQAEAWALALTE